MASPPPPSSPATAWSITVRLRHRRWLDLRAAAENVVLPGWWRWRGHGGERLSLLLRLRRGLRLAVVSRCAAAAKSPRPSCRILRFLRSKLPRFPSILRRRRKNPPSPARATAAAIAASRSQLWQNRALGWPARRKATTAMATAALCLVAVLAVAMVSIAAFQAMSGDYGRGYYEPVGHSKSWRFLVARKLARWLELEPRLYAWLMKLSLNRLLNW
uniref:Uncharacterized protein n=1 Tax=Leersia perrieri TaxID=77586 RepID=A0A0D9UX75_9ORYZ